MGISITRPSGGGGSFGSITGDPGDNAQNPNFTASTGTPGSNVELSGSYPNLNLQIPRGNPGADAENPVFTVSTGAPGSDVSLSGSYPNLNLEIPRGNPGDDGVDGSDGKTVRNGSGAPSLGLGVDGDFYIDTTAKTIYGPKTSGSWGSPTSIIGPPGDQGDQGDPGQDAPLFLSYAISSLRI